jgi:hypothetical protein
MDDHFRPVEGFDGYRVSREGEVQTRWLKAGRNSRLTDTWRPLNPFPRQGYPSVNLSYGGGKAAFKVHRLILETFVGPCPEGMVACHNDGHRANCHMDNIRWDTPKANCDDALKHGTRAVGSRCNSKLVERDVIEIRRRWAEGVPAKELAGRFGVSKSNVEAITSGRSWRHLPLVPGRLADAEGPSPIERGEEEAA